MRSILVLVGVTVVGVSLAFLIPRSEAQVVGGRTVQAWEYKAVDLRSQVELSGSADKICAQFEKVLNESGNDGWELCLEVPGVVVFKRPK
jgi:hypothetical protein